VNDGVGHHRSEHLVAGLGQLGAGVDDGQVSEIVASRPGHRDRSGQTLLRIQWRRRSLVPRPHRQPGFSNGVAHTLQGETS
jgi:hypothetical protein